MEQLPMLANITREDVLNGSLDNIRSLVEMYIADSESLANARNTWDLLFSGWDDLPQEVTQIPSVRSWAQKSVEEGVPWFYFLRADADSTGLLALITCCCVDRTPDNFYIVNRGLLDRFLQQGMAALTAFGDRCRIPEAELAAAAERVSEFVSIILGDDEDIAEEDAPAVGD